MSSGVFQGGLLGVVEEGSVDDVGEFPFEEAEGFSSGGSGFDSSCDEGLGVGVDAELGDGDPVDCGVGLSVASPVEPVSAVVG